MDVFLTGFSKRLLVAISIVVLLSMCVMPTEAKSFEHKKRHHRKQMNAAETKDIMSIPQLEKHKPRHPKRASSHNLLGSERNISEHLDKTAKYKKYLNQVSQMVQSTLKHYNIIRRNLSSFKYYQGKPEWMPRTNFKRIHLFNYNTAKRFGESIPERKYRYLIPQLYKMLQVYEQLFSSLLQVDTEPMITDKLAEMYQRQRQSFLLQVLTDIKSTKSSIQENAVQSNVTFHEVDKNKLKLDLLFKVQYIQEVENNDFIALRAYGRCLNNWFSEIVCSKKNSRNNKMCINYENKLKTKKVNKNQIS